MSELKGPAAAEIKQFIKEKSLIEFYLINENKLRGQIIWFDGDFFHIKLDSGQSITLIKNSLAYYAHVSE